MAHEKRMATVVPVAPSAPVPLRPPTRHGNMVSVALHARQRILSRALIDMDARAQAIGEAATLLVTTVQSGHKVLVAGNGGSAAQAQHFAAEFVGRFKRERRAYPMLSLTVDTSILTAVANDYSYQEVFARQVEALGQPDDLFIALSTSGQSINLLRAAHAAHERSMGVVSITGDQANPLARLADVAIRVPTDDTAVTQELHIMVVHILCDIAEKELAANEGDVHP
jgi:D-sedoheptulose 7-phosphate isomerase